MEGDCFAVGAVTQSNDQGQGRGRGVDGVKGFRRAAAVATGTIENAIGAEGQGGDGIGQGADVRGHTGVGINRHQTPRTAWRRAAHGRLNDGKQGTVTWATRHSYRVIYREARQRDLPGKAYGTSRRINPIDLVIRRSAKSIREPVKDLCARSWRRNRSQRRSRCRSWAWAR